jgi:hypothetical protein
MHAPAAQQIADAWAASSQPENLHHTNFPLSSVKADCFPEHNRRIKRWLKDVV